MLTKADSDHLRRIANAVEEIRAMLGMVLKNQHTQAVATPLSRPQPTLRPNEWRDIDG